MFAGLMAGLTLGLMSLSLVDLEVLVKSGRPKDRINAAKIIPLVNNQHLLLCTLLIGNSLAMEVRPSTNFFSSSIKFVRLFWLMFNCSNNVDQTLMAKFHHFMHTHVCYWFPCVIPVIL